MRRTFRLSDQIDHDLMCAVTESLSHIAGCAHLFEHHDILTADYAGDALSAAAASASTMVSVTDTLLELQRSVLGGRKFNSAISFADGKAILVAAIKLTVARLEACGAPEGYCNERSSNLAAAVGTSAITTTTLYQRGKCRLDETWGSCHEYQEFVIGAMGDVANRVKGNRSPTDPMTYADIKYLILAYLKNALKRVT